jgi:hypothetical protein
VVEMMGENANRGRNGEVRSVAVRLVAIALAVIVTITLAGLAAGPRAEVVRPVPFTFVGPTLCLLDERPVPCS